MCKYIHSLQQLCEKNDPEEYRYRQRRAEKDRKEFLNKIENLQSRTAYLEQKKRELENCLEQCEKEKEKLKVKIQNTEEKKCAGAGGIDQPAELCFPVYTDRR